MKRFRLTIISLFSLLLIVGCSKREELPKPSFDIVGHWKMTSINVVGTAPEDDSEAKAREYRLEVIFSANQSCTITIWNKSGEVTDHIEGRYLLEDDTLIISGPTIANYKFTYSMISGKLILNIHDGDAKIMLTLSKLSEEAKREDEQAAPRNH